MEPQLFNHTGFQAHLDDHKLMAARCGDCGKVYLPPRTLCPECYGSCMEWYELTGKGTLMGYTTIYVGLSVFIEDGYDREHPYCSGVVRLNEGPVISGQIIDADCAHPDDLKVGMPVCAAFIEHGNGESRHTSLAFEMDRSGLLHKKR